MISQDGGEAQAKRRLFSTVSQQTPEGKVLLLAKTIKQQLEQEAASALSFHKRYTISCLITEDSQAQTLRQYGLERFKEARDQDFEAVLCSSLGLKEQRRPKTTPGAETSHIYTCEVDPYGRLSFRRPVLEDKKTPLQRAFGDDKVLRVNLSRKATSSWEKFRQILKHGIDVGSRHFEYFVYKEEKNSKSRKLNQSQRCFFLCTGSSAPFDAGDRYFIRFKSLEECRLCMMHIHTVPTMNLYIKRLQLALSRTSRAPLDLECVNVIYLEDIPCLDERGQVVKDASGKALIHTDGTGLISEDLAKQCAGLPENAENYPALMQVRLFYRGMAIKGTLLADKTIPPGTILYRDSMLKVRQDASFRQLPSYNSLEICCKSQKPTTAHLSQYIIALLVNNDVPEELILEAVSEALEQAETPLQNLESAIKLCRRFMDMGELPLKMLLAGLPLNDPFVQKTLTDIIKVQLKSYAKGKVPLSGSYYLMGTADPSGTLKRNQVGIILENGPLHRRAVLVYKHPGMHYGDVHVFEATWNEELDRHVGQAKHAILFSTQGPRSVVDEIANSDLDGDMYWICTNEQIIMRFKQMQPWLNPGNKAVAEPKPTDPSVLRDREVTAALSATLKPSGAISKAATNWLVHMDIYLGLPPHEREQREHRQNCLGDLADLYYVALDSEKTGTKVDVPDSLLENTRPSFIEDKAYRTYVSKSIFGKIHKLVMDVSEMAEQRTHVQPVWYKEFEYGSYARHKDVWRERFHKYNSEMQRAYRNDPASVEDVYNSYRRMLFGNSTTLGETCKDVMTVYEEACAIYRVVFDHAQQLGRCNFNFAWKVAGVPLCYIVSGAQPGDQVCVAASRFTLL